DGARVNTGREGANDGNVVGGENFGNVRDGGNGDAAFVHTAVDGDVRVAVDDSGCYVKTSAIDDLRSGGGFYIRTDFGDFAVLDKDGAVFDGAFRDGEDCSVLNQDDGRGIRRIRGGNC